MAKTGHSFGHEKLKLWEKLHVSAGTFDGGQCIARHESKYIQRDSCSYRWQAVKRAFGEDKDIYNSHPDSSKRLSGTEWSTVAASQVKDYQKRRVGTPVGKEWTAESGKNEGEKVQKVLGKAFRTGFAPYSNQAHHEDGGGLGLPTHPNNHTNYSAEVKNAVIKALEPYESIIEALKEGEDHPEPNPKRLKNALVRISKKLHKMILDSQSLIKDRYSKGEDITIDKLHPQVATALGV